MKMLFIAGPMTGLPEFNFPAFHAAATSLRSWGFAVLNPADTGIVDDWAWADYLRASTGQLLRCDGVAVLPGWRESRGAQLEVYLAQALGMRISPVAGWEFVAINAA